MIVSTLVSSHGTGHGADGSDTTLLAELAAWLPVAVVAAVGVAYVVLAARARHRQGWPPGRTPAFATGIALLALGLTPRFDAVAAQDFGGHAAQHLLIAMVAPLALVLGSPVTLLLRTLPHAAARRLGRLLNSPVAHVLTHPVTALVLSSGGLLVLYFTPLYRLSTEQTWVHVLVHLHLVLSGFLFAWVIAGLDPAPRRAGVRTRLVVLGVSIFVHACVSQLLYAGIWVQVDAPVAQLRAAGNLMYFGGDIAELALALVMLLAARPDRAERSGEVVHQRA
ncbi:cytochrome c oxidase assembly protein [Nocardioides jishulii]|uniref:cytochrome c oxidase assembly protein n=1 Tax=Nocardioides jishulii TaxID=2575440 RepID=UPI001BAF8D27|nr:cytochrome c oxidase assembly protein [Nocardioides jishulii]